jgi:hypothetical protein
VTYTNEEYGFDLLIDNITEDVEIYVNSQTTLDTEIEKTFIWSLKLGQE